MPEQQVRQIGLEALVGAGCSLLLASARSTPPRVGVRIANAAVRESELSDKRSEDESAA